MSEASLIDCKGFPFIFSSKDRSRIVRNNRDLYFIAAIGLIFIFGGILSLISFHLTTRQHLFSTRSSASLWHADAAVGLRALW